MNRYSFIIILICVFAFISCNSEDGVDPVKETFLKVIPGGGDSNIPVQLVTLSDGDFLIISNSFSIGAVNTSKIRLIRMTREGELVYDQTYPSENLNWTAKEAVYLDDEQIIIGGSTNDGVMLFKVNAAGDSLQYESDIQGADQLLSLTKDENDAVICLINEGLNSSKIIQINTADLSTSENNQKTQFVDAVPTSNLFVNNNVFGFAINRIVNYSYLNGAEDLDEDATLKQINAESLQIRKLANLSEQNRTIAFGQLVQGNITKLFSSFTEPGKKNSGLNQFVTATDKNAFINGMSISANSIYLSGYTQGIGSDEISDFLLIKTDLFGMPQLGFNQNLGSTTSNQVLYHALESDGYIYAIGTSTFEGNATVVLMKLTAQGGLL